MAKITIKAPITVQYEGRYVAPGTPIELEEDEARRLIGAHGEYGAGQMGDPANTQTINVMDTASIEELNKQASINKGNGPKFPASGAHRDGSNTLDPLPSDADLDRMNKTQLQELALDRGVTIDAEDTKAEIVAKMKAAAK